MPRSAAPAATGLYSPNLEHDSCGIALVATLFGFVFAFTDMIVVYVLTRGGPFDTTQVLASLAFFKSVDGGDLGGGAAVALFLLPVLAAAAVGMLQMARRAEVT